MPKDAERDKVGGKPFRKETLAMEQIFDSLQLTTNRLNNTADSANELIRTTNERLESMGAGIAFSSNECKLGVDPLSQYDENAGREIDGGYDLKILSYKKIHGTWQLCVEKQHFVCDENGMPGDYNFVGSDEEPLLNAERELRIEAASRLPQFLKEYTTHLEKLAGKLSPPEIDN